MDTVKCNLYDILICLSNAVDLVTPEVAHHHQQVAYLAYRMAERMQYSREEQRDIFIGGMLHDIGALTVEERLALFEEEPNTINSHAFRSARLLGEFPAFRPISGAIRYHHVPWDFGNGRRFMGHDVPTASHLFYLADRVCVLIEPRSDILTQIPHILSRIESQSGQRFLPEAVDALMELGKIEHIWLSLAHKTPLDYMQFPFSGPLLLSMDELISLSRMVSHIIDFRSHFTATHSAGVANTARKLGELMGFSQNESKILLVAGYFHDLGKLTIDNNLLEKPAALNEKEFDIIRSHTFYTYQLLDTIRGFETINQWASYHHEKLNGNGYPFHLQGDSIPLGSRIMAVADIFTAINEDRPYRQGMGKDQAVRVLESMVADGSICGEVVSRVMSNYDALLEECHSSQRQAAGIYQQFFESTLQEEDEAHG